MKTICSSFVTLLLVTHVCVVNAQVNEPPRQGVDRSAGWFGIGRPAEARIALRVLLATTDLSRDDLQSPLDLDPTMSLSQLASTLVPGEVPVNNAILCFRAPNKNDASIDREKIELANRLSAVFPKSSSSMNSKAAEVLLDFESLSQGTYFQRCVSIYARFSRVAVDSDLRDLCVLTAIASTVYAEHLPRSFRSHSDVLYKICSTSEPVRAIGLLGQLYHATNDQLSVSFGRKYFAANFEPIGELPVGQSNITAVFDEDQVRDLLGESYPANMKLDEFQMYECCRSDDCQTLRALFTKSFAALTYTKLIELTPLVERQGSQDDILLWKKGLELHLLRFSRYDVWEVAVWSISDYSDMQKSQSEPSSKQSARIRTLGNAMQEIGQYGNARRFGSQSRNLHDAYQSLDRIAKTHCDDMMNEIKDILEKVRLEK